MKKPTKSSLWKARVIVSSVLSKYCLMFCHMRGVGCIPHERFHVSAAISPRRMATALKSSRRTTLWYAIMVRPDFHCFFRLRRLFQPGWRWSSSGSRCLIGLQCSGFEGAGLKPGIVEALEVELRTEEHEVVVVMILVKS